jgi:hypothetical protein
MLKDQRHIKELQNRLLEIDPVYKEKNLKPMCFRSLKTNLVWYRNYKAATTTYQTFFEELDWVQCTTQNIDWQQDLVFGHIRDPLIRYRKGLTETFFYLSENRKLIENIDYKTKSDWINFISTMQNIDVHCMTLEHTLGDNAKNIYWMPVDTEFDHKKHTLELLELYQEPMSEKIKNWFLDLPKLNDSTEEEIKFYQLLEQVPVNKRTLVFLDFDQCLYDVSVFFHRNSN